MRRINVLATAARGRFQRQPRCQMKLPLEHGSLPPAPPPFSPRRPRTLAKQWLLSQLLPGEAGALRNPSLTLV